MYNNNPYISIVIPVYNAEKYLAECLNSILDQSYKNFEIILINDGSIDSSGEICEEFAEKYTHVIVIHQENSGVSVARNRGIDLARGEWLTFVDSDDYLKDSYLNSFINQGLKVDTLIVQDIIHEDLSKKSSVLSSYKYGTFDLKDFPKLVNEGIIFPKRYVCSKFYNVQKIREYKLAFKQDIKYGEDLLFFLEYLNLVERITLSSEANYIYRRNEGSATYKIYSFRQYLDIVNYLSADLECFIPNEKWKSNKVIQELLGMFFYLAFVSIYREGQDSSAERIEKLRVLAQNKTFTFSKSYLGTRSINYVELYFINKLIQENYKLVDFFFPKYLSLYYGLRNLKNRLKKELLLK